MLFHWAARWLGRWSGRLMCKGCVLTAVAAGSVPPCGPLLCVVPSLCPLFPICSSAVLSKNKAPKIYVYNMYIKINKCCFKGQRNCFA